MTDQSLEVQRQDDGVVVAKVALPSVDNDDATALVAQVGRIEAARPHLDSLTVILDLKSVNAFSPGAVDILNGLAERLMHSRGRLILHSLRPEVSALFEGGNHAATIVSDATVALVAANPQSALEDRLASDDRPYPTLTAEDVAAMRGSGLTLGDVVREMAGLTGRGS
jgi:anti-anti-sigma regulatory factor